MERSGKRSSERNKIRMRSLTKMVVSRAVQNDIIWSILNATVVRGACYAKSVRQVTEENRAFDFKQALRYISPEFTVKHGPFKGMRYPKDTANFRNLALKVIGSYEREIHDVVEELCSNEYNEIVDIGCGEGYYAVGFALRIPRAKIYAYDTDSKALHLCRQMAALNGVSDRVQTGDFCDARTLRSIPFTKKSLIISDCEGYEKELFSDEVIPFLAHHDLLIETHDFIDIEISKVLRNRFQCTHSITVFQSVDDIFKAQTYNYEELANYDLATRKILLAEQRPHTMEWFYLKPITPR